MHGMPSVLRASLGPYVSATLPVRDMGATAARPLDERMPGSDAPLRHVVLPGRVHGVEQGRNTLTVTGSRSSPDASATP